MTEHTHNNDISGQNLVAHQLPLTGIHLIEASAGTGKTFNITRIYLRLLLERQLTVQQILVMTFTKDATEELRGRIDSFIRLALNQWHQLVESDDYFKEIAQKVDHQQAMLALKQALLYLDEAAIFTIHGFCKRVLNQYAFESGIAFNAQMEGEQQLLVTQAVQDWYRQLANDVDAFNQVVAFWPTPEKFVSDFAKAINQDSRLQLDDSNQLIAEFTQSITQAIDALTDNQAILFEHLVTGKTKAEQEKRSGEYQALLDWLTDAKDDHRSIEQSMPDGFIDGRRFSRSIAKQQLKEIFIPVNQVKQSAKSLFTEIARREALAVAKVGIEQVRAQIKQEKQRLNLLTFDDLVSTLAQHLSCQQGQGLADSLFQQYPYGLIDEFQDTDPAQLSIVKAIYFQRNSGSLFMIGDPKQAIYGFRGGDIFAYMSARKQCDYQWLMDTNWRSTQAMINGYNRLFYGNALDQSPRDVFKYQIPYHPVKPSPKALAQQRDNEQSTAALQLVYFRPETKNKQVAQSFRAEMATWCANEIVALLTDKTQQIEARDIALLVRDGTEAKEIKQALFNAGLASVYLSDRANLLHSEQTAQLIQLLKGILFLENERLFCAGLASPLLPYPAQALYQLQNDDLAWQEMKVTFSHLREQWLNKGFITMALQLLHQHLEISGDNSERCLTNLLHLFELLQTASQRHKQPQELLYWFEQQSQAEFPELESELRLESEENLIRIITQHGSKGLEYPIVFVPFASRYKDPLKFGNRNLSLIEYHNDQGELVLSLTGSSQARQAMTAEAHAETIRLLYVAVTRAERKCYLLMTEFDKAYLSPIGLTCQWQKETDIAQNLQQLVNDQPEDIALAIINEPLTPNHIGVIEQDIIEVSAAEFHGKIERDWWLSSFTALSRNIRDNGVSSPDRDNQLELDVAEADAQSLLSSQQLRFALTKGANTGNLLHYILEHINFAEPNWPTVLQWAKVKYGDLPSGFDDHDLAHWLEQALSTPLSLQDNAFTLASIAPDKILKEAEFYFPLANADVRRLSQLLTVHRKAGADKSATDTIDLYQQPFMIALYRQLKGMMHGFIDLIFEYQGKYYLADYKSNHLGDQYHDYQPELLKIDIERHNYDLQYMIYSLALHRYLAVTLENYQPAEHFGGVYYCYLRGMSNESQHQGCGVYYRNISVNELEQLDAIFAGSDSKQDANNEYQEKV
ncbi:RecBCD enzyme subunit RecB [Thalassotalea insulae]|uniref:RecBCD enzyme subunit RecB n=1 Tax=Thalassotalea insulae TaxID=2056778 RepID=A0ABQ6GYY8_9GAMM|nr:exodeoxyribonuclease V subunit beta [Thalassotalea insulae]GLX80454.1 RecBCD enzyme subunit RecB [Thalassotalea insulae]